MLDHTVDAGGPAARGAAIYAALIELERLAALSSDAPRLSDRIAVAEAIGARFERFREERGRAGGDNPAAAMEKAAVALDDARGRTEPTDWWEGVAAAGLCGPLADELAARLTGDASGSDGEEPQDGSESYGSESADRPLPVPAWAAQRLRAAMDLDPVLEARLALWSRRLVGESVVLARMLGGEDFPAVADVLVRGHAERLASLGLVD